MHCFQCPFLHKSKTWKALICKENIACKILRNAAFHSVTQTKFPKYITCSESVWLYQEQVAGNKFSVHWTAKFAIWRRFKLKTDHTSAGSSLSECLRPCSEDLIISWSIVFQVDSHLLVKGLWWGQMLLWLGGGSEPWRWWRIYFRSSATTQSR